MKSRGAYEISMELLAERLGISPLIYKVDISSTGTIVIYCHDVQDRYVIHPGEEPLRERLTRFS